MTTLFFFTILPNLNAIELSVLCSNPNNCTITTPQNEITNNTDFSSTNKITIKTHVQTFTNRSTIKAQEISVENNGNYITYFYNYGRIETTGNQGSLTSTSVNGSAYRNIYNYGYISGYVYLSQNENMATNIVNYGEMGGLVQSSSANKAVTIDNRGTINFFNENSSKNKHFKNIKSLTLQNYAMMVSEKAGVFNAFSGNATDNSHLVLDNVQSVNFADKDSKMILDFGSGFEFGKGYLLSKLVVDTNGANQLGVDFDRLVPYSDIYSLSQSGEYFIATLNTGASTIGNLYKANVRTMNNFLTISNSMIYPHKYSAKRNTNKRSVIRRVKRTANVVDDSSLQSESNALVSSLLDSTPTRHSELSLESEESMNLSNGLDLNILDSNVLDSSLRASHYAQNDGLVDSWIALYSTNTRNDESLSLQSNETFFYDSQMYLADNQRQTRTIRTRNLNTTNPNANQSTSSQNLKETQRDSQTQRFSQNLAQNINDYYFILTPFINHNLFFESGRYNLSGLEYGFLTAFSGKITPSNVLGTHFMMSYGNIGDAKDKEFSITNINLNVGLNYKFDMIWDMYIKARGDFFYFLNQVKTLTIPNVKPNTLGFGVSVAYGKDFNFGNGGVLGVEGGIDYKVLQSSTITLQNSADKSVSESYQKSLYNLIYVDLGLSYNKYFNTNAGIWGLNAGLGLKGNVSANKLAKSQIRLSALNHSVDMTLDNDKILGYVNLSGSYVLNHKDFDMEFSLAYYGNYGDRVISNGGGVEWRVVF